MKTTENTAAAIRVRAYHIWESSGRPNGREEEHWFQAAQELFVSSPVTPPGAPKAKKTPAKAVATAKKAATAVSRKASAVKKAPAKKKVAAK